MREKAGRGVIGSSWVCGEEKRECVERRKCSKE
jgi:hypothetical protein